MHEAVQKRITGGFQLQEKAEPLHMKNKSLLLYNRRSFIVLILLAAALVIIAIFATGIGAFYIEPLKVISILLAKVNISIPVEFSPTESGVLVNIRLPRVLIGAFVGGGLAASGVALQALFRNPLADPALIGVSSGASLLVALVIVLVPLSITFSNIFIMPAAAFAGAIIATLLVYKLSLQYGRSNVATMLLAGIAINALCNSGLGLLYFEATDNQLRSITFWLLGSIGGVSWESLMFAGPIISISGIALLFFYKQFNALLLGESEAGHLGVNVQFLKTVTIILTSLIVGASVAFCGIIVFVGLIIPHLVRLVTGPDHKILLPASILAGAALLLLSDLIARTIAAPAEIPIGVITSLIGTPFFIWLLMRDKRKMSL
jgi:iron complex transport system permease protein